MAGLDLLTTTPSLSLPGARVWLRQPEYKLDDPGNSVIPAFAN
jgi:hypothetical protein